MPAESHPLRPADLLEHAGFLSALARELVGDAHAAADLVQDAYVVALERPPQRRGALRGWLAIVTRNLARNRGRGEARRAVRERAVARPEQLEPDERALERLETRRLLVALVLELSAEQRTVLELRYFEGKSPSVIARELGVPLKTVKSRHTRALAVLRERLEARSAGWVAALLPLALPREGAGGAWSGVLGGILVKKVIVVAAAGLLALFAWQRIRSGELRERFAASRGRVIVDSTPLVTQPAPLALALSPEVLARRTPLGKVEPPTTGALQLAFRWPDGAPAADLPFALECAGDPAPRVEAFRARTDAEGNAFVEGLFAGTVRLWLDVDDFEAEVEAGATRALEFTLSAGFTVAGTVEDAEGTPVAGAEIWCGRRGFRPPGGWRRTTSASDGSFRLRGVGDSTPVGARKRGYVASSCVPPRDMLGTSDSTRTMRLVLSRAGGRVHGRVLDPDGKPLSRANVMAGPDGGSTTPAKGPGRTPYPAYAETDADGVFELPNDLAPGPQPIHASARGFAVWRGEVEVMAGGATALDIRFELPARIEGRVLGVDGSPAAGVRVLASEEERGGWYHDRLAPPETESDEKGWFVLDWVAPGTRELNANDYEQPELGRARASVVCAAGVTTTCELRLELGLTISGTVVDEEGAPLADWRVRSQPPITKQWHPRYARTDAHGKFVLVNLGDSAHDLTVRSPDIDDHPRVRRDGVAVGTRDLVLVVTDAHTVKGRLRGRLVAPNTSPGGFTLALWKEGANEGHFLVQDEHTGVFEVEAIPARYYVAVTAGGANVLTTAPFDIEAGGFTDLGDLRVEGGGRVEIELTGFGANWLERTSFSLERDGASSVNLEWHDGQLRSPEVMAGRWTVSMHEDEFLLRESEIEVVSGTTTRETLEVIRATMVWLHFTNPSRDEFTTETFNAAGARVHSRRYYPDKDDVRLSLGLAPGPVRIVVRTHAGLSAEVQLDVQPGQTATDPIELTLR